MRTSIVVAVVACATAVLAVTFVSGLGIADEAGKPLGVPAVAVSPGPSSVPSPTPTPTTDAPNVVDAPPPVVVELDDHGGDNGNSGRGNSGKGGGSDDG